MGISASGREMVSVISCGEIVCDPTIFLGVLDELLYKQRCGIDFAEVSALFLRLHSLNLVYIFAHIMLALSSMPVNRRSVSFLILEKGCK